MKHHEGKKSHDDEMEETKHQESEQKETKPEQTSEETETTPEEPAHEPEETDDDHEEASEPKESNAETPAAAVVVSGHVGRWRRMLHFFGRHKVWTSVGGVVVVLAVLAAVPWTRYKVAGLFLKQTVTVAVVDSQTNAPVTSADVTLAGVTAKTDNHGDAKLHVRVGSATVKITKAYYQTKTLSTVVPIFKPKHDVNATFVATGRQVPVVVLNKITGKPLNNAEVSAVGSEAKTDAKGKATIVLPSNKTSVAATVSASGYNDGTATIQVTTASVAANNFSLTPSGKIYFLSNLSGKIDVVKTNLDGTDRQTVLAGTGYEDPNSTSLLASRDWKYLALESVRTSGENDSAQLNLIDTTNGDKVTSIDSGTDVSFSSVGWDGDYFIYDVTRNDVQNWQNGQQALKSYDAQTGKITVLDQTTGTGTATYSYVHSYFEYEYIINGDVLYGTEWNSDNYTPSAGSKLATFTSIQPDGTGKKVLETFGGNTYSNYEYFDIRPYEADGLYIGFYDAEGGAYYTYEDGAVKGDPSLTPQQFNSATYETTYLLSPSGNQTFWSVSADGKNNLLVGDDGGNNGKQVATLSDYDVYGWYTDNYLLVSKDSSELYIMPVAGGTPIKISDYYKPAQNFYGYGSGYGGL